MYETTLHGNEFASFLQGRPGLIPSVPRVWGCTAFPLTSEIWGIPLTSYTLKKLLLRNAKILIRHFIYGLKINSSF